MVVSPRSHLVPPRSIFSSDTSSLLYEPRSPEGGLNVSYNCLDRHAYKNPDKTAIIYEADEPGQAREISYAELLRETCRIANVLRGWGVKKGDTVSIYLPMTW